MGRYSAASLDSFEDAHGIQLPKAYRELLMNSSTERLWSWNGWSVPPLMMIEEWYDGSADESGLSAKRIVDLGCGYYLVMDLAGRGPLSLEVEGGAVHPLHHRGTRLTIGDLASLRGRIAVSRSAARLAGPLGRWFTSL